MRSVSNTWAVVLAAGDGNRLKALTTTAAGEIIPKQFCSMQRDTCLLEDALKRAEAVALPQHICSVVAASHRQWWRTMLAGRSQQNILVQPANRGTAHGILLALLQIQARAPDAVVVMLPADHYVVEEGTMARSLRMAANLASANAGLVYLLGAEPDRPDQELGYIVPSERRRDTAAGVVQFVEKPAIPVARQLIGDGALWNTFIFAGSVRALLSMFEGRFAPTVASMRAALQHTGTVPAGSVPLELVYRDLDVSDFSKDVLERHEQMLQVLRVPSCGWNDLGTPKRVEETVRSLTQLRAASQGVHYATSARHLDLASSTRHMNLPQAS